MAFHFWFLQPLTLSLQMRRERKAKNKLYNDVKNIIIQKGGDKNGR